MGKTWKKVLCLDKNNLKKALYVYFVDSIGSRRTVATPILFHLGSISSTCFCAAFTRKKILFYSTFISPTILNQYAHPEVTPNFYNRRSMPCASKISLNLPTQKLFIFYRTLMKLTPVLQPTHHPHARHSQRLQRTLG